MDQDEFFQNLVAWADDQDRVRAVLLTSTRAIPGGQVDEFSDYDVILVVKKLIPRPDEGGNRQGDHLYSSK